MKIKNMLLMFAVIVGLTSCLSVVGWTNKPKSDDSSLIYGYLDVEDDVDLYDVRLYFMKTENAEEFEAARKLADEEEEYEDLSYVLFSSDYIIMDLERKIFAVQISEPNSFYLADIEVSPKKPTRKNKVLHFFFDPPENDNDIIEVNAGEMVYWGATTFEVDREEETGNLEVHPSISRYEILDLVAENLEGEGWDEWIEAERNRL